MLVPLPLTFTIPSSSERIASRGKRQRSHSWAGSWSRWLLGSIYDVIRPNPSATTVLGRCKVKVFGSILTRKELVMRRVDRFLLRLVDDQFTIAPCSYFLGRHKIDDQRWIRRTAFGIIVAIPCWVAGSKLPNGIVVPKSFRSASSSTPSSPPQFKTPNKFASFPRISLHRTSHPGQLFQP